MIVVMVLYHLIALLALSSYFFSWTGVCLAIAGALLSSLGINLCYHRMLAHKGLSCSKRVEHCLAVLGVMAYQFGPAYWVAIHRRHHQFGDGHRDPHSPATGFFWSHIGWLFTATANTDPQPIMERYAKDVLKDPFYAWLEVNGNWGRIVGASGAVYFAVGALAEMLAGGTIAGGVQFGASLFVWGAVVRTVFVWHVTFSINSVCHCWGYRNHATPDRSRNNLVLGILALGEGWHNNHHASPRSARHGHRWWELDLTWLVIKCLAVVGLVTILNADEPRRS